MEGRMSIGGRRRCRQRQAGRLRRTWCIVMAIVPEEEYVRTLWGMNRIEAGGEEGKPEEATAEGKADSAVRDCQAEGTMEARSRMAHSTDTVTE